jgi:hypothetical protein
MVWAYMAALSLAGTGVIIWRMIIWHQAGSTLGVLGFSLIILGVASGNAIRMTGEARRLHRQRCR